MAQVPTTAAGNTWTETYGQVHAIVHATANDDPLTAMAYLCYVYSIQEANEQWNIAN